MTASSRLCALLAGVAAAGWAAPANAFTIKDAIAPGCHEQITSQALRTVRTELPTAAPLSATAVDQSLINDVQFVPEPDMGDLAAVTLMLGNRDNDLKGRGSSDLTSLATVHGDPNNQREHCLRGPNDKEPDGSAAALAACRAFIRGRVLEALDGLDTGGYPSLAKRSSLLVNLSIRGQVTALLPTYYLRMGQAIHALQDSYAHTYRTADGQQVTVVLNWLNSVDKTLVESRDGPAHLSGLDVCNDPDDLRKTRHQLATDASAALLRATLDPQMTTDQKMVAVESALDSALGFKPDCTSDNHWCDAPEAQYASVATGCGCSGETGLGAMGAALVAVALTLRSRRRAFKTVLVGTLAITLASPLLAGTAQAQVNDHAAPPPTVVAVKEPGPTDPSQVAVGGYVGIAAAIDRAALVGDVGLRLRLSRHWTIGVDGEWNPWFALNGTPIRAGVVNLYATAILRYPMAYENINLRSSLSLGGSYLLTDFYGAPAGSIGAYFGVSPLSLEWKASRSFFLIVNPASIAVPIPKLTGVPFLYPQYRLTIGLEFYSG